MLPENLPVYLFYGGIILLLIIFRKKFIIQNKIIALYKTKVGLKLMHKIGEKHSGWVKWIGYLGIGAGFLGMIFILVTLIQNLVKLFMTPTAQSGVSLIIPGVNIPGSPITPPLIIGWVALFAVILIHEFSHGVVSVAHGVKVKSSGIVFFGPLMGAFVEPDEKQLSKKHETAQCSVFAAGPWSNMLLAGVAVLLLAFVLTPSYGALTDNVGFSIENVQEGYPAFEAGLPEDTLITSVNGKPVGTPTAFVQELQNFKPGEVITVNADKDYSITLGENPENPELPYLGVAGFNTETVSVYDNIIAKSGVKILEILRELFAWIGLLSLGIGLANLLPLGPVDGGRMTLLAMESIKGKKKGRAAWAKISAFALMILLLNVFWPAIKWLLGF